MDFSLSKEQLEIQEWSRKFFEETIAPLANTHSREKISTTTLEKLSREGFMTMIVPEKFGGLGLDSISLSLALQEISKVCGSVGVTVAVTNMIADILVREGTDAQREKFLSELVSGKSLTASFCLTENSSGSDAGALKTSAKKISEKGLGENSEGFEISGEKIYVTNGVFSNFFLVMARSLDLSGTKGVSAFLVERDRAGVVLGKEEDKMGLTGSSTIRMSFDGVKIPKENLVQAEGEGFKIAMRALDGGRISVASQALGIAKAALKAGVTYAKEREQFGKPIADFQAIQWKIADAATSIAAAEALIMRAASMKNVAAAQKNTTGASVLSFTLEASMAKLYATEMAMRVCEDMLQIHGGYGYTKDYPIERYCRDVRVTSLYEGTSEIQRHVIAREILGKTL
ncbi:MAG: acyl-CoA dehydrogenase family protein [Deltaproteobacteria bacterium]|nr:acyl-CoA dehydrogenase family protein [Deltaproteobacteria bacterium]